MDDDNVVTSLPTLEEERRMMMDDDDDDYLDEDDDEGRAVVPVDPDTVDPFRDDVGGGGGGGTAGKSNGSARISDRESSYHARRHDRTLREDGATYKDVMMDAELERERRELLGLGLAVPRHHDVQVFPFKL